MIKGDGTGEHGEEAVATWKEGRMGEERRERAQLISRLKFSGASRSTNRAGRKGSLLF